MPNNEYRLTQEILKRSVAKTWQKAKEEWKLDSVFNSDEPETCLCGHFPILEICTIVNRLNQKTADVGNCCVKKFLDLPSGEIFGAIKRIRTDLSKSLNRETLDYAFNKRWISEADLSFYLDTINKRKLSPKQRKWRNDINQRVLSRMNTPRF